jgi:hypothetical protein
LVKRLLLVLGLALLAAVLPRPAAGAVADSVFRVEVAKDGTGTWGASLSATQSTSHGVTATSTTPAVVSWNGVTGALVLRVGATVDSALARARIVVDWVSPGYEQTLSPDGVSVTESCDGARPGPRYGECFAVGDVAAGQTVTADVPLGAGGVSRFVLAYHVEDGAGSARPGLVDEPPVPAPGKLLAPAHGQYVGLYQDQWDDSPRRVSRFESKLGRAPAIVYSTGPKFPDLTAEQLVGHARHTSARGGVLAQFIGLGQWPWERSGLTEKGCPTITWQDVVESACNGAMDDIYRSYAVALRDSGLPVVLSTIEEGSPIFMQCSFGEGSNECWQGHDHDWQSRYYGDPAVPDAPERFRDFHRHVVDIFNSVGAANVTWLIEFQPEDDVCTPDERWWECPDTVYPGDDYVDWIGVNFTGVVPIPLFDDNQPVDWQYERTTTEGAKSGLGYTAWQAAQPDKPIISPNTYLAGWPADMRVSKAPRYQALLDLYPSTYPAVKAVAWWDEQSDNSAVWFGGFGSTDLGFFHDDEAAAFRQAFAADPGYWPVAPQTAADATAPAAVTDLRLAGSSLVWTAPSDAVRADVRCRPGAAVTAESWSRPGFRAWGEPLASGPNACALTSTDALNQTSRLSNVVVVTAP